MKTKILSVKDKNALIEAVKTLRRGGLVVYPTETAYGLGADATRQKSIKKVFHTKGRKTDKKIACAFSGIQMAQNYIEMDKNTVKLAKRFLPGPLTIVKNGKGFRIPKNTFALKMIGLFGRPVTATSANISGNKSPYKIAAVVASMKNKVDAIIDAGDLKKNRVSTVFDMDARRVLRRGKITKKQIMNALKEK